MVGHAPGHGAPEREKAHLLLRAGASITEVATAIDRSTSRVYQLLAEMPDAEAILARIKRDAVYVTAFGETKSRDDWASDPRCQVSAEVLGERIRKGWPPQDAITVPRGGRRPARRLSDEEIDRIRDLARTAARVRAGADPNGPGMRAAAERDRLVWQWACEGLGSVEIARQTGLGMEAINVWLRRARRRGQGRATATGGGAQ